MNLKVTTMTKKDTKKELMIEALEKSLGVVSQACQSIGISRQTHYRWIEEDPEYKFQVESIDDVCIDFAENQLFKKMKDGSDAAIIFYLKTKGKKRGYIEKTQIDHSIEDSNIQEIKVNIKRK